MRILRDARAVRFRLRDDDDENEDAECLINLLFIVVRSSSSDTKHQLRSSTHLQAMCAF